MIATHIGTWHEREAREFTENHTYYAADWRKVRLTPGEYPAKLSWKMYDPKPWPEYLLVGIPAVVTGGEMYNGIGGVNYSSEPVKLGPITHSVHMHAFQIRKCVNDGWLTLDSEWEWLALEDKEEYYRIIGTWTKDMVRAMAIED